MGLIYKLVPSLMLASDQVETKLMLRTIQVN
jgi:hypothetical protein